MSHFFIHSFLILFFFISSSRLESGPLHSKPEKSADAADAEDNKKALSLVLPLLKNLSPTDQCRGAAAAGERFVPDVPPHFVGNSKYSCFLEINGEVSCFPLNGEQDIIHRTGVKKVVLPSDSDGFIAFSACFIFLDDTLECIRSLSGRVVSRLGNFFKGNQYTTGNVVEEIPTENERDKSSIYFVKNKKNKKEFIAYYFDFIDSQWKQSQPAEWPNKDLNKNQLKNLSGSIKDHIMSRFAIPPIKKPVVEDVFMSGPYEVAIVKEPHREGKWQRKFVVFGMGLIPVEIRDNTNPENKTPVKQVFIDGAGPGLTPSRVTILDEDGTVRVWSVPNNQLKKEFENKPVVFLVPTNEPKSVAPYFGPSLSVVNDNLAFALSPDKKIIFSGNPNNPFVKNFPPTLQDKQVTFLANIALRKGPVNSQSVMVAQTDDGQVFVWGYPQNVKSFSWLPSDGMLKGKVFSQEVQDPTGNQRIYIAMNQPNQPPKLVVLGDPQDPEVEKFPAEPLKGKQMIHVQSLRNPKGKPESAVAITPEGEVNVWSLTGDTPMKTFSINDSLKKQLPNIQIKDVIAADDQNFFFLTKDNRLFPVRGNEESPLMKDFPHQELDNKSVKKVLYDPLTSDLYALTTEGEIIIWGNTMRKITNGDKDSQMAFYSQKYDEIKKAQGMITDVVQTSDGRLVVQTKTGFIQLGSP